MKKNIIEKIPRDILLALLDNVPLSDLLALMQTNSFFMKLSRHDSLWKKRLIQHFPFVRDWQQLSLPKGKAYQIFSICYRQHRSYHHPINRAFLDMICDKTSSISDIVKFRTTYYSPTTEVPSYIEQNRTLFDQHSKGHRSSILKTNNLILLLLNNYNLSDAQEIYVPNEYRPVDEAIFSDHSLLKKLPGKYKLSQKELYYIENTELTGLQQFIINHYQYNDSDLFASKWRDEIERFKRYKSSEHDGKDIEFEKGAERSHYQYTKYILSRVSIGHLSPVNPDQNQSKENETRHLLFQDKKSEERFIGLLQEQILTVSNACAELQNHFISPIEYFIQYGNIEMVSFLLDNTHSRRLLFLLLRPNTFFLATQNKDKTILELLLKTYLSKIGARELIEIINTISHATQQAYPEVLLSIVAEIKTYPFQVARNILIALIERKQSDHPFENPFLTGYLNNEKMIYQVPRQLSFLSITILATALISGLLVISYSYFLTQILFELTILTTVLSVSLTCLQLFTSASLYNYEPPLYQTYDTTKDDPITNTEYFKLEEDCLRSYEHWATAKRLRMAENRDMSQRIPMRNNCHFSLFHNLECPKSGRIEIGDTESLLINYVL